MKAEKENKAAKENFLDEREKERVLKALSASSLRNLTRDEILMALKEGGVESLEGLVTELIETTRDSEQSKQSTRPISLQGLSGQRSKEGVSAIVHRVPKLPFVLDGIEYDPKDIRRFNGRELHFVIGSPIAPGGAMLAFEDRSILTNWLQIIYLSRCVGLNIASTAPFRFPGGTFVHGPEHPKQPASSAVGPVQIPPTPVPPPSEEGDPPSSVPHAFVELRMFDQVNFKGNGVMLDPGMEMPVLQLVPRGQVLGNSWNDAIRSMLSTESMCAYWERPSFDPEGTIRIVAPHVNVYDLGWLGFDRMISSIKNFG